MNENFDVFDDFVMTYDMNEKMIGYKYNHSYRTVHQAEEIARSLELDEEDMNLASNIALLHGLIIKHLMILTHLIMVMRASKYYLMKVK